MTMTEYFPCNSAGKESTCNAGDPGLIPGLGRSAGEGISYPLQYSCPSLVAQLVKNLPKVWETGLGRPLGEGNGYPLQDSGLENSIDGIVHGIAKSWTQLSNFHFHFMMQGSGGPALWGSPGPPTLPHVHRRLQWFQKSCPHTTMSKGRKRRMRKSESNQLS